MYCVSYVFHKPDYPIMKHVNFTTVVNIPSQSARCSASVKEIKKIKCRSINKLNSEAQQSGSNYVLFFMKDMWHAITLLDGSKLVQPLWKTGINLKG